MTIKVENFDLAATLSCGQCFRWVFADGFWQGIVGGRRMKARQDNDNLFISDECLVHYYDLDRDYGAICQELKAKHLVLKEIIKKHNSGIRILQQDPWEALCSFIVSQNNNIPRITKIIERLCGVDGAFPTPEAMLKKDLSQCGLGYRAEYLKAAAATALDFAALRTMPLPQAREKLMQIKGIGPKVAECALLFGLHRLEAFPQDVWIKRGMGKHFPGQTHEIFGEYAGIAQQYLYVLMRGAM